MMNKGKIFDSVEIINKKLDHVSYVEQRQYKIQTVS